jgi:tight adherence protein C
MNAAPVLIALLIMGSVFTVFLALRAWQSGRKLSSVSATLGHGAAPNLRQVELSKPWSERVLRPMLRRLYRMGRYLTPSRNIEQLQHTLIVAGLPGGMTVTDFLGLRFLAGALLGLGAFLVMLTRQPTGMALLISGIAFLAGMYLPNFWLRSKAQKRQKEIQQALPDALDMMSICVDAGLGFEAAIQKVAYQSKTALAYELRRVISEIRVGVPRAEALRHLADRTDVGDVSSLVGVLIQADQLGIAIRNVLNTQSVQMRIQRRQRAQEAAAKAPIKMMLPMVMFIFPALFIVILGPAVPSIMGIFG